MGRKRGRKFSEFSLEAAKSYGIDLSPHSDGGASISPVEASEIVGLTSEAVKHWIYSGQLPATKLPNGYWRIKVSEFERFLKLRVQGKSPTVMVAAQPDVLRQVMETIQPNSCNGTGVANVADAILKAQMNRPDMLVIDAKFPEAWTLLKKISEFKFLRQVPVVLLSPGELTEDELDTAMQAGVVGCLTGPLDAKALADHIRSALRR